jgi:osmotically-inducible protein OsmY
MVTQAASLNDRVLGALQNDPRLKNAVIEASSLGGIITLTGIVRSEKERQTAEEIARGQEGVLSVLNEIKVSR